MPVVLHEGAPVVSAEVEIQAAGLGKAGCGSKQKIRKIVSAQIAAKAIVAIGLIAIAHGHVQVFPFTAELKFVRSLDECGNFTVGNITMIPGSRRRLVTYRKFSGYHDVQCGSKISGLRNVCARLRNVERSR